MIRPLLPSLLMGLLLSACAGMRAPVHTQHENHVHQHKLGCEHNIIVHDGHKDYDHNGHYHYIHKGHVDEHGSATSGRWAASAMEHQTHTDHSHKHGEKCGHKAVKHGDHTNYIHGGHYHRVHGDHVDEHGLVDHK